MGRKGTIPQGDDFLPGVSAEDLRLRAKRETDGKTVKKLLAAMHRKRGMLVKEIAGVLGEGYETARMWLMAMHREGASSIPRRKSPGRPRTIPPKVRRGLAIDAKRGPRASGVDEDSWNYKLLHRHLAGKYGIGIAYSTAVKNFREMGLVFEDTPRQ